MALFLKFFSPTTLQIAKLSHFSRPYSNATFSSKPFLTLSEVAAAFCILLRLTVLLFFFFFLAVPCSMQNSQPGSKPTSPAVEVWSFNHWTTRELTSHCTKCTWSYVIFRRLRIWVLHQMMSAPRTKTDISFSFVRGKCSTNICETEN